MDKESLRQTLVAEDFRPETFSLDEEEAVEALCLRNDGGRWYVFYSERGRHLGKREFERERDACAYFLEKMRSEPALKRSWRGVR